MLASQGMCCALQGSTARTVADQIHDRVTKLRKIGGGNVMLPAPCLADAGKRLLKADNCEPRCHRLDDLIDDSAILVDRDDRYPAFLVNVGEPCDIAVKNDIPAACKRISDAFCLGAHPADDVQSDAGTFSLDDRPARCEKCPQAVQVVGNQFGNKDDIHAVTRPVRDFE